MTLAVMASKVMEYLFRLLKWFRDGIFLYIFIFILILTFQLDKISLGYQTVDNIRFYGLLLQLIGTTTIIYSLKDKLELFKGHGLTKLLIDYFKDFPLRQQKIDGRLQGTAISIGTLTGRARLTSKPKEDLREIIEYFQKEIDHLHKTFEQVEDDLRREISTLEQNLNNVRINLSNEISETKSLIKSSNVSNIWIDAFGLACIFWGLILGTAPDLIINII